MSTKSPNVILVITDDQGYGDLGCTGNPWIQTAHIDAFYEEAVRFTDFHVSPLCTPTRGGADERAAAGAQRRLGDLLGTFYPA